MYKPTYTLKEFDAMVRLNKERFGKPLLNWLGIEMHGDKTALFVIRITQWEIIVRDGFNYIITHRVFDDGAYTTTIKRFTNDEIIR